MTTTRRRIRTALVLAVLVAAVAAVTAGPSAASATSAKSTNLSLVAYSTPKIPFGQLIAGFQKTPAGADVKFTQSYGASTDQARAVVQGLPTDIVQLSLAADINLLVDAKLVSKNWNRNKYNGMVTNSIVTFLVRKGNPKNIQHLGRPDQARHRDRAAEPGQLGRRALGRDGRLRPGARAEEDAGAGARRTSRRTTRTSSRRTRAAVTR